MLNKMIPYRGDDELTKHDDYFGRMFRSFFNDDFLAPLGSIEKAATQFKVDIKETDTSYVMEADLPGIKKEDIAITYENNYLSISAKKENSTEEKNDKYIRQERSYGQFSRSFYIENANKDKIEAAFNDGVLTVTVPKSIKQDTVKKIEIK